MLLMISPWTREEDVNVGNNQEATTLELTKKVKAAKYKSTTEFNPLPKDDPKRRCPNTDKLGKLVGLKRTISLETGLKRTVAWFAQNL